jgi:hypothetical protein
MLAALGINCLQVTATGLDDNGITHPADAIMVSRIGQLAAYAAGHRMVLNPQLGYQPAHSFGNGGVIGSAAAARMARIFAQQANTVFIDVLNEVNYYPAAGWGALPNAQSGSDLSTMIASIRAVTRCIPLTLSVGCVSRGDISGPWMSAVAPLCDFHNVHSYFYQEGGLSAPASLDFAALRSASWYLGRFVVGETGMPAQYGAASQTAWLNGCGVVATGADCLGSIIWGATDTSAAPGRSENVSSFGLADSTGTTVRSALALPVYSWPATL